MDTREERLKLLKEQNLEKMKNGFEIRINQIDGSMKMYKFTVEDVRKMKKGELSLDEETKRRSPIVMVKSK